MLTYNSQINTQIVAIFSVKTYNFITEGRQTIDHIPVDFVFILYGQTVPCYESMMHSVDHFLGA